MLKAQEYIVGVEVCDTICPNNQYLSDGSDCSLSFVLDSALVPYVTGLTFQIEITGIQGVVLSNFGDTVKVGNTFPLPAPNESSILKISMTQSGDSFSFLTKLVGRPEIAGETYFCNLGCYQTLALCNNGWGIWLEGDSICTVESIPNSIYYPSEPPTKFQLKENFPNPFNPTTRINYSIPEQSFVTIRVFDVLGREVEMLVNKEQPQGNYEVEFDASALTSGIYFYRIKAGDFVDTKKMVLMK